MSEKTLGTLPMKELAKCFQKDTCLTPIPIQLVFLINFYIFIFELKFIHEKKKKQESY
jgi:hypothetical protein